MRLLRTSTPARSVAAATATITAIAAIAAVAAIAVIAVIAVIAAIAAIADLGAGAVEQDDAQRVRARGRAGEAEAAGLG